MTNVESRRSSIAARSGRLRRLRGGCRATRLDLGGVVDEPGQCEQQRAPAARPPAARRRPARPGGVPGAVLVPGSVRVQVTGDRARSRGRSSMPTARLSGTCSLRGGATAARKSERRQATTRWSPGRIAAFVPSPGNPGGYGILSRPSSTGTMSRYRSARGSGARQKPVRRLRERRVAEAIDRPASYTDPTLWDPQDAAETSTGTGSSLRLRPADPARGAAGRTVLRIPGRRAPPAGRWALGPGRQPARFPARRGRQDPDARRGRPWPSAAFRQRHQGRPRSTSDGSAGST